MNEIDLEKAGDEHPSAPHESTSGIRPGDETGSRGATTGPTSSDEPRRNAKMWSTYLEEAEKEAKELAEVLKNGLESLLIFAGLFAGVVASFVIDSRRDLQPDPQQILLADIRNALRNESAPQDTFEPSTSSLWINGLWFASLMITLFSAILGVLAKSWLVKYTPVVSGKESEDAYRRYIRDDKAKRWHLERIITAAPLLIQIALFLFALGFGLQSVDDHPTLGWLVLGSLIVGLILYTIVTLLPLFIPWCPLQTPLSDTLSDALRGIAALYRSLLEPDSTPTTRKNDTRIHLSWRDGPNKNEVLSNIWHKKLIQSTNPSNVDEALAELTRVKLSDKWWQHFVEWDTPKILCQRLRESMHSTRREYRYEVLCDHLRSLLGLVGHLERSAPPRISEVMKEFLDPGNPLNRWNVFPEEIRALAFSARTPIMIACDRDYSVSEMEERPWETMVYDMHPDHRRHFAMAACRGLVGGQDQLRKVSAFSLVMSIAKATVTAIGTKSEWGAGINKEAKDDVEHLGRRYLVKLFEEIANGWKMLLLENLDKSSSSLNSEACDIMVWSGIGPQLKHRDSRVRTRAISMLEMFATDADFEDAAKSSIYELANVVINDPDEGVRTKGTKLLTKLVQNEKFQDSVKQSLPRSLISALSASTSSGRVRAIYDIATLVQRPEFQSVFQDTIEPLISHLIKLTVDTEQQEVFDTGMKVLRSLAQHEGIRDKVKIVLLQSLKMAFRSRGSIIYPSFNGAVNGDRVIIGRLVMIFESSDFRDFTNPEMSQLVEMAMSQRGPERRITRMKALVSLTQGSDVFRSTILPELPKILETYVYMSSWIDIFISVSYHAEFHNLIEPAVPELLEMMMDSTDPDTHTAGVKALTSLAEPLRGSVRVLLPHVLMSALRHPNREARILILKTLARIPSDYVTKAIIQGLIWVVATDNDDNVRVTVVETLSTLLQGPTSLPLQGYLESAFKGANWRNGVRIIDTFGKNPQFQDIIVLAMQNLVELAVINVDANAQEVGMKLVGFIVQNKTLGDISLISIVPRILGLVPNSLHWQVRIAWFEVLTTLAKDLTFRSSVGSALPNFVEIAIKDESSDVRAAGLKCLASIARDDTFRSIIEPGFTEILHSAVNNPDRLIRAAWAEAQVTLSQISSYQDYIESGIPQLADGAVRDTDEDVRVATVRSLIGLAQNDKLRATSPTIRGVIKSALSKSLDSACKDPHWEVRIAWVDGPAKLAHSSDFQDTIVSAIPKLVKLITDDENQNVRTAGMKALTNLVQDSKLDNTIISALPKSLDLVFRAHDHVLRVGWAQVLHILISRDVQLGGMVESAVPQIVNLAIRDGDTGVHNAMLGLLALLAKDATKLQDIVGSALSNTFDLVMKSFSWRTQFRAIDLLRELTQNPDCYVLAKLMIPQLLKISLGDRVGLRKAAINVLNNIRTSPRTVTKEENRESIRDAIILAVPSSVVSFAPEGHDIRQVIDSLLHFAVAPTNPELTAKAMESILKPMLKGSGWITRATAVEVLGVLKNYKASFRHFIQSAVPDIITLALEDKEDEVRAAALRSLANLAEEAAFRNKIKAALPQLMQLIEISHLRGPVTELISLLAVDNIVRKDIVSCIISPLVRSKMEVYPIGLLELLSRLIIDQRFSREQASDEVALSVASMLLMQPGAASLQFKTATALWCNYGVTYTSHPHEKFSDNLVDLFLLTLFGRHVTLNETEKWRSMGSHLPFIAEQSPEVGGLQSWFPVVPRQSI